MIPALPSLSLVEESDPAALTDEDREQWPHQGILWRATTDRFHLDVPTLASYRVTADRVQVLPASSEVRRAALALALATPYAAACWLRGHLVLHASAVLREGRAHLFVGDSGAGKSTAAAALHQAGHPVLVDDVSTLLLDEAGEWCVVPVPEEVRLTERSRDLLGLDDRLHAGGRGLVPIASLTLLRIHAGADLTEAPLSGLPAMVALRDAAYNSRIASALLGRDRFLHAVTDLLGRGLPLRTLTRPRGVPAPEQVAAWRALL